MLQTLVRLRADIWKSSVEIQQKDLEIILLSGRMHYNKLNATLEIILQAF